MPALPAWGMYAFQEVSAVPVPKTLFAQLFHKSFRLRLKKKKSCSDLDTGEGEEHEDSDQIYLLKASSRIRDLCSFSHQNDYR